MRTSRWARSAVLTGISLLALGAPLMVGVGASFAAGTAPSWEPDTNAAAPYGNVTFYDANGNQVTSGTNLASPFAYAVAGTAADSGATKATLVFDNPQHGVVPGNWTSTSEAGPTTFNPSLRWLLARPPTSRPWRLRTRSWPPRRPASPTGWGRTSPTPRPATPTPSRSA